MGREPTEVLDGKCEVKARTPKIQGGLTASVPIESFRQPHTLTTLSWCTGDLGRGFVTCKDEYMSEKTRGELNKDTVFAWTGFGIQAAELCKVQSIEKTI